MKLSILLWCLAWCLTESEFLPLTAHALFNQAQPKQVNSSIVIPKTPVTSLSIAQDSSTIPSKTLPNSPLPASQQPLLPTSMSLTRMIIAATVFIIMIVSIYLSLKEILTQRALPGSNANRSALDNIPTEAARRKHPAKSGHDDH